MMLLVKNVKFGGCYIYSKKRLKKGERHQLELVLDGLYFTCGSSLQELDLPSPLDEVYIRSVKCFQAVEKLYYSAGYDPICIYCAGNVELGNDSTSYPQCVHCSSRPQITKR